MPSLEIDLAEACLLSLGNGKTVGYVAPADIRRRLALANPAYKTLKRDRLVSAICSVFPIHKNLRSRTRRFKVRIDEYQRFCLEQHLTVRPLEDAQDAWLGRAVLKDVQLQDSLIATGAPANLRSWRVIVRLLVVERDALLITVPQWKTGSFWIYQALVPRSMRDGLAPGARLFAMASEAGKDMKWIQLRDFQIAGQPRSDDGLA